MDVTFCSHPPDGRTVDDAELAGLPYPLRQVGWQELVERSDFLSVHVPLAPSTKHLIDASAIAAMKPTAILVNTARGPIVDEAALVTSLANGHLAGAGLDVYEDEPRLSPVLPTCRTSSCCRTSGVRRPRCGPGWPTCAQATPSPSREDLSLRTA